MVLTPLPPSHRPETGLREPIESARGKVERELRLLRSELEKDPSSARAMFSLAQAYRESGDIENARAWYSKRIEASGWSEETWYARYMLALTELQAGNEAGFIRGCLEAYDARPWRAEPLHALARHYRIQSKSEAAMLLCEMAERIPYPSDDTLFVDDSVYCCGIIEEMSISGYYCASPIRRERGRASCLRLTTDRGASEQTRFQARSNWLPYARGANDLFGSMDIHRLEIEVEEPWVALNPSIAISNSMVECAVRAVNYRIIDGRYQIADPNRVIRTRNFLCALDAGLHPVHQDEIIDRDPGSVDCPSQIAGFEDCRLFRWRGRWWCSATVRDRTPDWRCEIALLELGEQGEVERVRMLRGYHPELMQKNWLPFVRGDELNFLYMSDPLVILSYDPDSEQLREAVVRTPPLALDHLRGGSQLIPIDGGWLYLTHEVIHSAPSRTYLHRFVSLDEDFNIRALSEPFFFMKQGIEFAAGLAWDEARNRLLVSFGVDDREAYLCGLDPDRVLQALRPLPGTV